MRVLTSNLCSFCHVTKETRIHLFWECPVIQPIWAKVILFCKTNVSTEAEYTKANCVLLGFKNPLLNVIMLCCKYRIHIARLFKLTPSFEAVLSMLKNLYHLDLLSCKFIRECSKRKVMKMWHPLIHYQF